MEVITREQCEKTLNNFTKTNDMVFQCMTSELLTGCSGYISTQYAIKICYRDGENEKNAQFFLKKNGQIQFICV